MVVVSWIIALALLLAGLSCGGGGKKGTDLNAAVEKPAPPPKEASPPAFSLNLEIHPVAFGKDSIQFALMTTPFHDLSRVSYKFAGNPDEDGASAANTVVPVRKGIPVTIKSVGWINDGEGGHFGPLLPAGDVKDLVAITKGVTVPNGALLGLFTADGTTYDLEHPLILGKTTSFLPPSDGSLLLSIYLPHDEDPSDNTGFYIAELASSSFVEVAPPRDPYTLAAPKGFALHSSTKVTSKLDEAFFEATDKSTQAYAVSGGRLVVRNLSPGVPYLFYSSFGSARSAAVKIAPGDLPASKGTFSLFPETLSFRTFNDSQTLSIKNTGDAAVSVIVSPGEAYIGVLDGKTKKAAQFFTIKPQQTQQVALELPTVSATKKTQNPGLCSVAPPTGFSEVKDLSLLPFGVHQTSLSLFFSGSPELAVLPEAEGNRLAIPLSYEIPGPIVFSDFVIEDESDDTLPYPTLDENKDGIQDKNQIPELGETIRVSFLLENEGEVGAKSYSAYFSSASPLIKSEGGAKAENLKQDYSLIDAGDVGSPKDSGNGKGVILQIPANIAAETALPFFFQGVDSSKFIFPCQQFQFPVHRLGPLSLAEITIDDDNEGRSTQDKARLQDGNITEGDAGKIIELLPVFANEGTQAMGEVTVTMRITTKILSDDPKVPASAFATIIDGATRTFPALAPKSQSKGDFTPFFVKIADDYDGSPLVFHLSMKTKISAEGLDKAKERAYTFRALFDASGNVYDYLRSKQVVYFRNRATARNYDVNGDEIEQ